jgi:hypothetical protein
MIENLIPIDLPPGLMRNGTKYQAAGRWYDANLVRFYEKTIGPIGGWRLVGDDVGGTLGTVAGVPRAAVGWAGESGAVNVGIGTNSRLYVLIGGVLSDITPTGLTAGGVDSGYSSGAYGAGVYGSGFYGTGSLAQALTEAGTWQLDTFGADLVGVLSSDGKLYVWTGTPTTPAAVAAGAPINNRGVVVTPERFLVALGADGDARKVAWASQETVVTWVADSTNTAGDFILQTNGRLIAGRRTDTNTLLWTDTDLHEMSYIGGVLVYSFIRKGDNCGLLAPNAVALTGSRIYWMGRKKFFTYDGYVQEVPSDVTDYVFGDFNWTQAAKVNAVTISAKNEVWWFYPSANATENDRYVIYNTKENHWVTGSLVRTAGFDSGATPYPMMFVPAYAAQGTLTSTGTAPANNDTVTIDGKVYTFQTVLTNTDGHVLIGASAAAALTNLKAAINLGTGSGTLYAAATTKHTSVIAEALTATTLLVRAKYNGSAGAALTTTEVSAQLSWGAVTLVGGTSSGYGVGVAYEHEVGTDQPGGGTQFIESGPFEVDGGNSTVRVQRLIPDDTTQGNGTVRFYLNDFPKGTETTKDYVWSSLPTNVRFTTRIARMKLVPNPASDWRIGVVRLGGIPGGRR